MKRVPVVDFYWKKSVNCCWVSAIAPFTSTSISDESKTLIYGYFRFSEKFFKNKLLLSFLAIVLVIKLIKIKIFWILPLIVGVTAAKKLLLKFILFLFPALAHLFKLCSYYHKNYHDTKYHHHHHRINHMHTVRFPMMHSDVMLFNVSRYLEKSFASRIQ